MENAEYGDVANTELKVVGEQGDVNKFSDFRKKMLDVLSDAENKTFDVGFILQDIYDNNMYLEWGFASFREYVETELAIDIRSAQYHLKIQKWYGKMPPNVQSWARKIGWTKVRMLLHVITPENAAEWKNRVAGKSVGEIKKLLEGDKDGSVSDSSTSDTEEDQEDKPKSMSFKLFNSQYSNVDKAIQKAKEISNSSKPGHALDLICTEYLATNVGVDSIHDFLLKVEKDLGVKLLAYVSEDDEVIYGADLVNEMLKNQDSDQEKL